MVEWPSKYAEMKRAKRRKAKAKMKKKARKAFPWAGKRAERWADYMALCSDYCCGNPRKWFHEKTLQEKKADERAKIIDREGKSTN
jgi:hypothetical protein